MNDTNEVELQENGLPVGVIATEDLNFSNVHQAIENPLYVVGKWDDGKPRFFGTIINSEALESGRKTINVNGFLGAPGFPVVKKDCEIVSEKPTYANTYSFLQVSPEGNSVHEVKYNEVIGFIKRKRQKEHEQNYEKKREVKRVSFNIQSDSEKEILEYAQSLDDFSGTIKKLLTVFKENPGTLELILERNK